MKTIRLLSLCLLGSALSLSACAKEDAPGTSGAATASASGTTATNTTDDPTAEETGDTDPTTFGSEDDTTSLGFVPDEDVITVAECDPWMQDCPDGEKCVAYGSTGGNWDSNKCVQVLGDGQVGDPCTYDGTAASTDTCAGDGWCWNVNEEGQGVCTGFCTGSPDDPICEPGYSCSIANNGSITLCLIACDPLLQDCPVEGESCFYDFSGNFVCAFETQNLPAGEPCGFINDCFGGGVCLSSEVLPACAGSSCCAEYCDLSDPVCTIMGTECQPLFEEGTAPPEYVDVGVCIIPGA